jgi:hypothetical protein
MRKPKVQVLSTFARFKKEDVVAGVQIGEAVESRVVVIGGFGVKLRIFVGVRKEGMEVVQKMSVSEHVSGVSLAGLRYPVPI